MHVGFMHARYNVDSIPNCHTPQYQSRFPDKFLVVEFGCEFLILCLDVNCGSIGLYAPVLRPQTLYTYPESFRAYKVLIAAQYSGAAVKVVCEPPQFEPGVTNKSPEFLAKFPLGKVYGVVSLARLSRGKRVW